MNFRSEKKRHQRYDLPSHRNDISYYIFAWNEILANWLPGVILSWYLWYIFGRFKNICLHSKQTWGIKLNKNNLWSGQNSWLRLLCPFMDLIPISFLSTKSALFRHVSQVSQNQAQTWPKWFGTELTPHFSQHLIPGGPPCYLFYSFLLVSIQLMHIYWFYFILKLLFKIAIGDIQKLEDVREKKD